MNETYTQMKAAASDLTAIGVRFAVVGGLAVSLRTEPRFTRDVDFAVAVAGDEDAERVTALMMQRGYRVTAQVEHETANRLSTVRLAPPRQVPDDPASSRRSADARLSAIVDLLFASCGIEQEVVGSAEPLEALPGWTVPVARVEHLVVMKILARDDRQRPQDLVDLRSLLALIDTATHGFIRDALQLVDARGFARGRDLVSDFNTLVAE